MGETKVNLKHLLKDLRDGYPFPLEEVIITELIANALDSKASKISFITSPAEGEITIMDNGEGMNVKDLQDYHDIASTTKVRGKGIGFAGVGIKLALLISEKIITETKSKNFYGATSWHLESERHAPWEFFDEPSGFIKSFSGTAVSLTLTDLSNRILDEGFVKDVIQRHFYPLLDIYFMDNILKYVYKKGVKFFVNNELVTLPPISEESGIEKFWVKIGKREKPVGVGIIRKVKEELPEGLRGIAISTYGKVIKRGWDWLGIIPKSPSFLTGIVEVPKLAELLTTNKSDFLKDSTSLQKFYRYRKAIQFAIEPVLQKLGEAPLPSEQPEKDIKPLQREIQNILGNLITDFPELGPLLGKRRTQIEASGILGNTHASPIGEIVEGVDTISGPLGGKGEGEGLEIAEGDMPGERIEKEKDGIERGEEIKGRKKRPGVMIGFKDEPERDELGWLIGNIIWVNRGHPAYIKAESKGFINYHTLLSVAFVLANYLEKAKSPLEFITRFLKEWGK